MLHSQNLVLWLAPYPTCGARAETFAAPTHFLGQRDVFVSAVRIASQVFAL